MTNDFVLDACIACCLRPEESPEVVQFIMKGARKIFAILILIREERTILKFIENDQYSKSNLDDKIPFSMETLRNIDPDIAEFFYIQQWEFSTPYITGDISHRVLDENVVLPFLQEKFLAEGSFGVVHEVVIHRCSQSLRHLQLDDVSNLFRITTCHIRPHTNVDLQNLRIVRKTFKSDKNTDESRDNELRNLAVLKLLRSPYIVELLGSYTQNGQHSFLFPLATGNDIASLFECPSRPKGFETNVAFLLALSGLATALEKVHEFTHTTLNLSLIGCHHDIKPKNVLVHDDRFILADFGLSRFRPNTESSKSMYQSVGDFYIAPECEDYENGFESGTIGRSADIWSLGCIIAEVFTYMNGGAEAIREFKTERKCRTSRLTTYTFHVGGKPHEKVFKWFSDLESRLPRPERLLVPLVREMLEIDQDARPKVRTVTLRLLNITASALYDLAISSLNIIAHTCCSFELDMECMRLECCEDLFCNAQDKHGQGFQEHYSSNMPGLFQDMESLSTLREMHESLTQMATLEQSEIRLRILQIRHLVDSFWATLPDIARSQVLDKLEARVAGSEDLPFLERSLNMLKGVHGYRKMMLLAAIKRATILSTQSTESIPKVSLQRSEQIAKSIRLLGTFETSNLALLPMGNSHLTARCFVEWLYYDSDFNEELMSRVDQIVQMLESEKPKQLLGLNCYGFYHDPSKPAFGLVFPFPEPYLEPNNLFVPVTLAKIIYDSRNLRSRPLLGDRYKLASALAIAVAEFHKVGWLHKCLSSYSVILFHPGSTTQFDSTCFRNPSILGFSHSRPDATNAYTKGPKDNEHEEYLHPDYTERKGPYKASHDYYSLGMILLEIGLWMDVGQFRKDNKIYSPRKLRDELLTRRVPLLGHYMGQGYCEAVRCCLQGLTDGTSETEGLWYSLVVDRLGTYTK